MKFIRSALGQNVDIAAQGAAKLGSSAGGNYLKFAYHFLAVEICPPVRPRRRWPTLRPLQTRWRDSFARRSRYPCRARLTFPRTADYFLCWCVKRQESGAQDPGNFGRLRADRPLPAEPPYRPPGPRTVSMPGPCDFTCTSCCDVLNESRTGKLNAAPTVSVMSWSASANPPL